MARRWLIAGVALVLALAGGAAAVALSFDPNGQKPRIADAVFRATGRQLTLAGPLRVRWGLSPMIEASDVSFANMAGGTRPQMVMVGQVEARIDLLPLLSRRLEIASVTLVRPDILLETDAGGNANWQFARPASPPGPPAAPASGGPRTTTVLDSLRVQDGRLTWHSGVTGQTIVAAIPTATLDLAGGPAHLLADAQLAGTAVKLDAVGGTWPQITGEQPGPWPLQASASVGDATLAIAGTVDPAARAVSGRVSAAVPDLAQLGVSLQRPGWPALHDVHLAATLPGLGALPQDVALQIGASDLGRYVPGAALAHLGVTWPPGQPARLDADGTLGGGPWHVGANVMPAAQGATLQALAITSPVGDAAGDLALSLAPRPAVRGALASRRIDIDALLPLLQRAEPPAPLPSAPAAPAQPAPPTARPIVSTRPLPWRVLRSQDLDLQWTFGTLRAGGADYHDAAAHIVLQDGVLRVDPASVQAPEGRLDLSASADSRSEAPPVVLNLRSAAFALDPLLTALGLPGGSDAVAEIDVALHAAGQTPHALAASLTGHAGIAMVDADVSNAVLASAFGELLKSAGAGLDPGGPSHVRCLAIRADAQDGLVTLSTLKLDSARLSLEGGGTVNLADETLALRLRPLLRLGGAGVSAPVKLDGGLRHPAVALDKMDPAGRIGLMIGGLAGPADTCSTELTAARDGRPGRLPAERPPAKAAKPADLLRSLLR